MSTTASRSGRPSATASAQHTAAVATALATVLRLAEEAYAADADHVARSLLVGLLLDGAVERHEVDAVVEHGLARFHERRQMARTFQWYDDATSDE
ncbi:MAG: hypothetical protein HY332_13395 [Chloroflexi bacterium]|nr:hypothetical protein [Chloroflexota bacterium]